MWILYILGGLVLLSILWHSGLLPELLMLVMLCVILGAGGALIAWIIGNDGDAGFKVGGIVGIVLYALYCIARIVDPTIEVWFNSDGSTETINERTRGIIGLVVLAAAILYSIFS